MDKRLREADRALIAFLHNHPRGVTMEQILSELREKIGEQELRASVWKLLDDGAAEFHRDRLRQLAAA
jgi:hypothetical protein